MIEELSSIVAIKAEQREGQSLFDLFDLFEGIGFSFAPDGALFGPAGGNIDTIDGIGEHAGEGIATVGDSIGLKKAGFRFVPLIGFDGDLSSQEGTGFGCGSAMFPVKASGGAEETIDGGGRDCFKGFEDRQRERAEELGIPWEPEGQDDLEAFGTGEIGLQPDVFQGF
jgi:hypothetical protein